MGKSFVINHKENSLSPFASNCITILEKFHGHLLTYEKKSIEVLLDYYGNKTLGRALDPRANGTWLSKLTE